MRLIPKLDLCVLKLWPLMIDGSIMGLILMLTLNGFGFLFVLFFVFLVSIGHGLKARFKKKKELTLFCKIKCCIYSEQG